MGTDCKSVGDAFVGSNPTLPTKPTISPHSSAAEHFFGKEEVTGSILVEGSIHFELEPLISGYFPRKACNLRQSLSIPQTDSRY